MDSHHEGALRQRPLMVYLHIPFCRSKCHFCDWVQAIPKSDLLRGPQDPLRQSYIEALCREIRQRGEEIAHVGYVPQVVYWGGGTASSLSETEVESVAHALEESVDLRDVTESTIECSPETLSPSKLRLYREVGFNRVSLGIQSLMDGRLRQLGRAHTSKMAVEAAGWAAEAGFEQINVDLMCGFPDESSAEVEQTISRGLGLPATHISVYTFRPTPGTLLHDKLDERLVDRYVKRQLASTSLARNMVASAGFNEYAAGYFGKPSLNVVLPFRLRADTVGLGSGAISILGGQYSGHQKGRLREYIADPLSWDFSMPAGAAPVALSLLRSGLSVFDGIERSDWRTATGTDLEVTLAAPPLRPVISYLRSVGHLAEDDRGVRLPKDRAGNTLLNLTFRMSMAHADLGRE